jgi:phospholipid/cholesterol/gamma-HCH transport system substrate-binding protein
MNERVMQFRIGMFVLAAGLVLLMMIIWFGESPTILRTQVYLKVHYIEAPGVADGIPVRRNGIKIGEVMNVEFDDRPNQPDGVIVTLSLDPKARLKKGTVPRITRALIGDVAIEMTPGKGNEYQEMTKRANDAPIIEGDTSGDPSKMLADATDAIKKVGGTLTAIEDAAKGVTSITKKAEGVDDFITTWTETGKNLGAAGKRIDMLIKDNENDFKPAIANLKAVSEKLNKTLDEKTTNEVKVAIERISAAGAKLDAGLTSLNPVLADLSAPINQTPLTNFGQTIWRANRIASDVGLLTRMLNDGKGGLNTNGSIQKLLTSPALHDNWNKVSLSANELLASVRPVVNSVKVFAEKVSRDPSALTRGALQR